MLITLTGIGSYSDESFVHDYKSAEPENLYVEHIYPLRFELEFDLKSVHAVVQKYFHKYIYSTLAAYVTTIILLKHYMRDRKPYDLRKLLFAWNCALAVFSTIGSMRTMRELIAVYRHEGLRGTICHQGNAFGVTGLWTLLFVMSKIPEVSSISKSSRLR